MEYKDKNTIEINVPHIGLRAAHGNLIGGLGAMWMGLMFGILAVGKGGAEVDLSKHTALLTPLFFLLALFLGGAMYSFSWYSFLTSKETIVLDKQGVTIKRKGVIRTKSTFIPKEHIAEVGEFLYEDDGNFIQDSLCKDKRVPLLIAGVKRFPILLGANAEQKVLAIQAISEYIDENAK